MSADLATVDLTADEARRLTERIRLTAHTFAESRDKLISLVGEAKAGNAHAALGYPSWTAYLSDVLGDEPLRLARDDRKELVGLLAAEGMSTRAIAPIVGADHATVVRDIASTGADAPVERPATVTSLDGRERPARVEPRETLTIDKASVATNMREVWEELFPHRKRKLTSAQQVAGYVLRVGGSSEVEGPSWTTEDVAALSDAARAELDQMFIDSIRETARLARDLRALHRILREAR